VEEAGKAAGSRNALNIAILAALNIADEYLQMMGAKEDRYNQLESRAEQLIHLMNNIR
jgi:cell division protein ZapA (FtsZ GTPase activity inhibitor)